MPNQGDFTVSICDADQWFLSFAGVALSRGAGASGYADGVFLKGSAEKPSFTTVEGTDGSVARSKTNSRLYHVELHLLQTNAQSNGFLSSMLAADEANPNGAGVGTFIAQDLNGTSYLKMLKCWLEKWPDWELDRTAKERVWLISGVRSKLLLGGN
jgi:hypothetical protein